MRDQEDRRDRVRTMTEREETERQRVEQRERETERDMRRRRLERVDESRGDSRENGDLEEQREQRDRRDRETGETDVRRDRVRDDQLERHDRETDYGERTCTVARDRYRCEQGVDSERHLESRQE